MEIADQKLANGNGPNVPDVDDAIAQLELLEPEGDIRVRAALGAGAMAFVHFDPNTT
jgi:hypothetical protein